MKKQNEEKTDPLIYDYVQLLHLVNKYDMDSLDTRLIVEVVFDYLDRIVRW